jgi:DNA-directed RNA polymerase subunit D
MKIEQIKSKDDTQLVIEGTTISFVNALRRACTFEAPVLAMEDIYLSKNSSALYDEMIANRLGLIPLKTDVKSYTLPAECKCKGEGCARCQVKLTLKIKGPCMVYARDLKTSDPAVKPVFPDMPIVELIDHQELEFEAIAVLGKGKEHAKWSAGHSFYRTYPIIKIGSGKKLTEGLNKCPKDVFSGDKVKNLINCDQCGACEEYSAGAIKVSGDETKFIFTLEPWGQVEAKEIFKQAASILKKKTASIKIK